MSDMCNLILYKRRGDYTYEDSCLYIKKPKNNIFKVALSFELTFEAGFSLCQSEDRFVKKIARDLAQNRLKERVFKLDYLAGNIVRYIHTDSKFVLEIAFDIETGRIHEYDLYKTN